MTGQVKTIPITEDNARLLANALVEDIESLVTYIIQSDALESRLQEATMAIATGAREMEIMKVRMDDQEAELEKFREAESDKPRIIRI